MFFPEDLENTPFNYVCTNKCVHCNYMYRQALTPLMECKKIWKQIAFQRQFCQASFIFAIYVCIFANEHNVVYNIMCNSNTYLQFEPFWIDSIVLKKFSLKIK